MNFPGIPWFKRLTPGEATLVFVCRRPSSSGNRGPWNSTVVCCVFQSCPREIFRYLSVHILFGSCLGQDFELGRSLETHGMTSSNLEMHRLYEVEIDSRSGRAVLLAVPRRRWFKAISIGKKEVILMGY